MKVLIKNGLVIDPKNNRNDYFNILIENGLIKKIAVDIDDNYDYLVNAKGMIISPGFVDLHPNFCDPGVTSREDLKSGSLSATRGGYTFVVLGTDNKPAPSECNVIDYINNHSSIMPVNIYPCAAVTVGKLGIELADLQFLYNHNIFGFFDGLRPIRDKELLREAMMKIKSIGVPLALYSSSLEKVKVRGVNDSKVNEKLGLKNLEKSESEALDLKENLDLAIETGVTLDLTYVTTKESVDLVRKVKKDHNNIYAETPALNLILVDKVVQKYGSLAKVVPPFRQESDRKAVIDGLKDGTIDIISSNHSPCTEAEKDVKLKDATNGAISLETVLGVCGSKLVEPGLMTWKDVITKISLNPAKLYKIDKDGAGSIDIDNSANLTIFNPTEKWIVKEENILSKSKNTPLIGTELVGKVKYTICEGKLVYRDIDDMIIAD